ncbi:MAG TPA: gephyrin-like molybdotransferase Glp [Terracidiphilus sp.]|jgi:molybdopterin molybdotransferase
MSSALPSYEQAAALVTIRAAELAQHPASERVALESSAGRVVAEALYADRDQPPFPRSTRDGYACWAAEAAKHKPLRVAGSIRAGQAPGGPLAKGSAWEIMTGAPVPPGADAVVMLEHVERNGPMMRLFAARTASPGENIVPQGAEARAGDEVLPAGTCLGAQHIALAAACGHAAVSVYRRPRVAILTTGDELVPVATVPGPGQIRNSNAFMLAALVAQAGGAPWMLPTAADTDAALDAALQEALAADMLLISGGVSAGKFDLVEPALGRRGARFHFTGVRIQPGKPLVFGEVPRRADGGSAETSLPFFGLPGNPISSAATFLLFGSHVLSGLAGNLRGGPRFAMARIAKDVKGKPDLTRFVPSVCNFNPPGSQLPEVTTVPSQGSGDLSSFSRSNCFLVVPEGTDRLKAGDFVRILLI